RNSRGDGRSGLMRHLRAAGTAIPSPIRSPCPKQGQSRGTRYCWRIRPRVHFSITGHHQMLLIPRIASELTGGTFWFPNSIIPAPLEELEPMDLSLDLPVRMSGQLYPMT